MRPPVPARQATAGQAAFRGASWGRRPRLPSAAGAFLLALTLTLWTAPARGQTGLVGQWTFDRAHVSGTVVSDLAGNLNGQILGAVTVVSNPEALFLDGAQNYVRLSPSMDTSLLPAQNLTVEAWVALRSATEWGGIIGCIQDNGSFEHGWLLGYRNASFSFALSANGTLTYLAAPSSFAFNQWYHVVGTYDGSTQKLYINGVLAISSSVQSGPIDYAPAPYAIGAYQDDNEFYPADGFIREACVYNRALTPAEVVARYDAQKALFPASVSQPDSNPDPLPLGPYARFVGPASATISWETDEDSPSIIEYGPTALLGSRLEDATPKRVHALTLTGLEPRTQYFYKIPHQSGGQLRNTELFELDTDFNLAVPTVPDLPSPYPDDDWTARYAAAAQGILDATGIDRGYCLVYGCGEGRLAYELARRSQLHLVGVTEDAAAVGRARLALRSARLYGSRITLFERPLDRLPFAKDSFNLIVSDDMLRQSNAFGSAAEVVRVLRPAGGTAFLGFPPGSPETLTDWAGWSQWLQNGVDPAAATTQTDPNRSLTLVRLALPGAGEWSHTFGDPAQTACSHDERVVGRGMKLQWFGRPGPRGMIDRQGRNPSPLTINGFLFVEGDNRVFGQDAYNGNVNWTLEIPHLRRVNVPRDSSNMCADDESLYLAVRHQCWRVDALTGSLRQSYNVVPAQPAIPSDWGYLASEGDRLYGSGIKEGSTYTIYDGPAYWYDSKGIESTAKVCSDNFFCLAKDSGQTLWTYHNGLIVNSSIAIGGGRVYFLESRNPTALSLISGRVGDPSLWLDQYLVVLDAATGSLLWEKAVSLPSSPFPMVLFLCYAEEKLILSDSTSRYDIFAYAAPNGQLLWQKNHPWNRDNHGGHLYHPIIVNGTVYLEPYGYDLATGNVVKSGLPVRGGCSTMSAAARSVLYINWDYDKGSMYFWDLDTDERRQFAGSRSSCWLSFISGSGMALSPTASSGCTCRYPLQTSIGFSAP
jgi:outer membrane protein assembly factor BamB